jgi:hypothetical protein
MNLFAILLLAASGVQFDAAKAKADADEAALPPDRMQALLSSQGDIAGQAFQECISKYRLLQLPSFTIVMALDGSGRVTQTWVRGGGEFGGCIRQRFESGTLFRPPHDGFLTSFEFTFQRKT